VEEVRGCDPHGGDEEEEEEEDSSSCTYKAGIVLETGE